MALMMVMPGGDGDGAGCGDVMLLIVALAVLPADGSFAVQFCTTRF